MGLPDFTTLNAIGLPAFVLTQDPSGRVVYAFMNTVGCRSLLVPPSEVVGKTAREIFYGRTAEVIYERHQAIWDAGAETVYETPLSLSPDVVIWVETRVCPQFGSGGQMTHMVGISRDVTRQKELERANLMSESMTAEIKDFLAIAAHDLRSPIANVRMLTDALRDGFFDMGDGKLEMIGMIEEISEKALSIVTDTLSNSMSSAPKEPPCAFDFFELCENILVTLDPQRAHRVQVHEQTVHADRTLVNVVLRNLLDNAIKHGGKDALIIDLSVYECGSDGITLTVADNGRGFDDPSLAFLDEARDRSRDGFGLASVRRLVNASAGRLYVSSPKGGPGAVVHVDLPGHLILEASEAS